MLLADADGRPEIQNNFNYVSQLGSPKIPSSVNTSYIVHYIVTEKTNFMKEANKIGKN